MFLVIGTRELKRKKKKEKVSPVDERWTMKSERKELSIWRQQRLGENGKERWPEKCARKVRRATARRREGKQFWTDAKRERKDVKDLSKMK